MLMSKCRRLGRHEDDCLCFCPDDVADVRKVLSQAFINGWVDAVWYQRARELSGDHAATQKQLEALLFMIEHAANDCYATWKSTL